MNKKLSILKENTNNNNKARSKSPQRLVNGVRLYNFSEIASYRYINKPFLNQAKKDNIKQKLDLENLTDNRVKHRVKDDEMFIGFDYNPFSKNERHSKSHNHIYEKPRKDHRNIIDEISKLKHRRIDRQKQGKALNNIKQHAKSFSGMIQKPLLSSNSSQQPILKGAISMSFIDEGQNILETDRILEFDDIVKIKEQNYFKKQQQQMNIFKILYDKDSLCDGESMFKKFYFSFNSMIEKFQKMKIQIYRDISREARKNVNKKIEPKSLEVVQTFNFVELNFSDLINVAAGRTTSEHVYEQLNTEKANERSDSSDIENDDITYPERTENRGTLSSYQNQNMQEIQQFLKLSLTKQQHRYQKLNQNRKIEIQKKLKNVLYLISKSIYDKKMHSKLKRFINKQLQDFLDADYHQPKDIMDRNKKVRVNKESKNKREIIKLTKLNEVFQLKKQHDMQISQLIKKRM